MAPQDARQVTDELTEVAPTSTLAPGTSLAPLAVPGSLLKQLEALEVLADAIASVDPRTTHATTAAEASQRVHAVMDRLTAQRWGWIAEVESAGLWGLDAAQSFPRWLAASERLPVSAAHRDVRVARTLTDHLPHTAAAAREGSITAEHARLMATVAATSDQRRAALSAPVPGEAWDDAPTRKATTPPDTTLPETEAADGEAAEGEAAGGEAAGTGAPRTATAGTGTNGTGAPTAKTPGTGEQLLLAHARVHTPAGFATLARRFAHVADPEADERGYRQAREREFLDVTHTLGGYHLAGFLTDEHGQLVKTALRAITGVPQADDGLRATQRRAVALGGMARLVLDRGLVGKGSAVRPHLSVVTSWSELTRLARHSGIVVDVTRTRPDSDAVSSTASTSIIGVAQAAHDEGAPAGALATPPGSDDLDDWNLVLGIGPGHYEDGTGPIPRSVLARIAADCELTRVVLGPDSEILDVGRTRRTFTGARRRAVIARDRHCVWPGCDAPPQIGQIHHAVTHWADGGRTTTDNAALLCFFHHRHVDTHDIAMRFVDGSWSFHRPDRTPRRTVGTSSPDEPP